MKAPRWSRSQYIEYCKKTGTVPEPPRKSPVAGRTAPGKGKNKTEEAFEMRFRFEHPQCSLLYEAVKLRIDGTCWYLPDFFAPELMTVYEVKGPHVYEDSVIKFKAARAIHGWLRFEMWQLCGGVWREIRRLPEPRD